MEETTLYLIIIILALTNIIMGIFLLHNISMRKIEKDSYEYLKKKYNELIDNLN